MKTRIGINGLGRSGRQALKAILQRYPDTLEVVAVNDLGDPPTIAWLFKHDSNYGAYPGAVEARDGRMIVDGHEIALSQERDPADSQLRAPSTGYASLNLAHYVGQLLLSRQRPLLLLSLMAVLAGLFILAGPHYSRTISLDKTGQQVILTRPRWFFLTRTETYPLQNIFEIRADWDRERTRRAGRKYRVELVIGHSEGTPLSRDYLFYKTVFPLTESYRYDRETAQGIVAEIRGFLGKREVTA